MLRLSRKVYGEPLQGTRRAPDPDSKYVRRTHGIPLGLMVGKIGFSYEPILAFPTRQGCTPESYELVATFISV